MQMDTRTFGIEFEFKGPWGGTAYNPRGNMKQTLLYAGYDCEVGNDGSEWEVKTPPLSGGHGFKTLKRFLEFLKALGCTTTRSDGLHCHFGAPEFIGNKYLVKKLVNSWKANEVGIHKMVHPDRRLREGGATPIWRASDIEKLEDVSLYSARAYNDFWGYRGTELGRKDLNVASLGMHGTIEIRLHEGTIEYDQVYSWIRFGQCFINSVLHSADPLGETGDTKSLLREIKVSRNARRFLHKKI